MKKVLSIFLFTLILILNGTAFADRTIDYHSPDRLYINIRTPGNWKIKDATILENLGEIKSRSDLGLSIIDSDYSGLNKGSKVHFNLSCESTKKNYDVTVTKNAIIHSQGFGYDYGGDLVITITPSDTIYTKKDADPVCDNNNNNACEAVLDFDKLPECK